MKAIKICLNTKKLLEEKEEIHGVVHSVFQRVCNIETKDEKLIPIISGNLPNMPRSISLHISQEQSMHSLGLEKGKKIVLQGDLLRTLEPGFRLELNGAAVWDGRPDFGFARLEESQVQENLRILKDTLLDKGKLYSLAPLLLQAEQYLEGIHYPDESFMNQYCVFIWPRVLKLMHWISTGNVGEVQGAARQMIGFGLGLTPSADDLLAGVMIAMIYGANYYDLDKEEVWKVNHAMIEGAEHRTTKVSAEMLSFAAKGEVSENIRQLVVGIFSETKHASLIERALSVINNGETSGSDCIAGIYIGCILSGLKNKERKMRR